METPKVRLDGSSELQMELCVSLFIAGELDQVAFKGPFQLKCCVSDVWMQLLTLTLLFLL